MRYLPLIAAALLFLTLAGCGESESTKANKKAVEADRSDISLRLAYAAESGGDLASAEHYFQQAATPGAGLKPRLELAEFYRRHKGGRQAMAVLNAAAKEYPHNAQIMRAMANVDIDMGSPGQALKTLNDAIEENSGDPLLYNSKGVALDMLGKYTEARIAYNKAIMLDPENIMTFKANLAMSYITTQDYAKAISILQPLADAPDATPQLRQNLALAYGLKGDNKRALYYARKDLSDKQAEENIKFYNMLSEKGGVKAIPPATVNALPPIP